MPKSLLITLMGSLGDVARALTLVAPLKEKFPAVKITWLVEPKCYELVKLHPQVDCVIKFERGQGLSAIIKLYQELAALKFDLCLDLQRHLKSAIFSRISGAKKIVGFHRKNAKEFNWLFSNEKIPYFADDLPKIEHYWKFLEHLNIAMPSSARVNLELGDEGAVLKKFNISQGDTFITLVLGSSWKSKDWPISGYHKLIEELAAKTPHMKFVLSGGREHEVLSQKLMSSFEAIKDRLINVCGKSSLRELCVLTKNSKVVVGPDSGPGHLASMFDVPFVGLFGPTDAARTAPYGEKVQILSSRIGCSPCYRRECPGLDKICMRMISPGAVTDAVLEAI